MGLLTASRNHHMFSSISEFIVKAVSGITDVSCAAPLTLRPAQALGVSAAHTTLTTECGDVTLEYQRTGGVQCARVPEGRSMSRPGFREVADVELTCGENGGIIKSVDFASWGQAGAVTHTSIYKDIYIYIYGFCV